MPSVPVLTRVTGKPTIRLIDEAADSPSVSSVVGSQAARSLWADATVTSASLLTGTALTTLNLATGAAVTTINVGTGANPTISMGGGTATLQTFGGTVVQSRATATTTDATVTSAVSIALADNTAYLLEARIVGRRTNGADRACYIRRVAVYREAAGVATIQGAIATDFTRESAAYNGTISVTGNNVSIDVKGLAAHDVSWSVTYVLQART